VDGVKVYVGGKYGDTPTVVAESLERAMVETLNTFVVPPYDEHPYDEQWTCAFLDGEMDQLRCTVTVVDSHGETHRLYVERYDVES
jgi:hypothetical protein